LRYYPPLSFLFFFRPLLTRIHVPFASRFFRAHGSYYFVFPSIFAGGCRVLRFLFFFFPLSPLALFFSFFGRLFFFLKTIRVTVAIQFFFRLRRALAPLFHIPQVALAYLSFPVRCGSLRHPCFSFFSLKIFQFFSRRRQDLSPCLLLCFPFSS